MILPAFGMISEVIPVFSRKPIFGYEFVAASTVAIAFLQLRRLGASHVRGRPGPHRRILSFGVASMLIAVPTGVKIFNWIATMWGGRIRFTTSMMFAVAFLIDVHHRRPERASASRSFPIDWQLTDTYYLVAHFHYVLFGGTRVRDLRGTLLLVPENDRPHAVRAARHLAFLADAASAST